MNGSMLAPAIVFLAVYILLFLLCAYFIYSRWRRCKKQRILGIILMVHILARIAASITSIGSAVVGLKNYRWFVASIILTQQGYLWIVFCFLVFIRNFVDVLKSARSHNGSTDTVVMNLKRAGSRNPKFNKFIFELISWRVLLIGANAITIVGSAAFIGENGYTNYKASLGLRIAGCSIFLFFVQVITAIVVWHYRKSLKKSGENLQKREKTFLCVVLHCYFVLTVRGIYSIVGIVVVKIQFFNFDHLGGSGSGGLAAAYCMGALMEWTAASLILFASYRYDFNHRQPDTIGLVDEAKSSEEQGNNVFTSA